MFAIGIWCLSFEISLCPDIDREVEDFARRKLYYLIRKQTLCDRTLCFPLGNSRVKPLQRALLEQTFVDEIDREPYMMDLCYNGKPFTLVSFHAIPKKKQPETEIKYFKFFPELYPGKNLIFLGCFNTPQSHTVFNPLKKMGYRSLLQNQ